MNYFVPIDVTSVKKNPNAGNTVYQIYRGSRTETRHVKSGLARSYIGDFLVAEETVNEPDSFTVSTFQDYETVHSLRPEPDYFYDYEDITVRCDDCGKSLKISQLEYDDGNDSDRYSNQVCPHCRSWDCVSLIKEKFDREIHAAS